VLTSISISARSNGLYVGGGPIVRLAADIRQTAWVVLG